MRRLSVNSIFRAGYRETERSHPLPEHMRKAAHRLMVCRTAVLGGHVQGCPDRHVSRVWYNSCRHRMCPQCAYVQVEDWLERQQNRLLACDHYHVVFTIPRELRFLLHMNYRKLVDILFRCSRETIFTLCRDPKWMNATPGVLSAFHSWTRTLDIHPHVHCLISGGGITDSGRWSKHRGKFLFPFRVARDLFRNHVNRALRFELRQERLILPEEMSDQQFLNLLNRLGRKKWNVKIMERYRHANGVAIYLARYLRGGPISSQRIRGVSADNKITFDAGRNVENLVTVSRGDFLRQFLRHVPPDNTILVRASGLYASKRTADLNRIRKKLSQPEIREHVRLPWQKRLRRTDPTRCEVCRKQLVTIRQIRPMGRNHDPPDEARGFYCGGQ